jgi:hypothetical protein
MTEDGGMAYLHFRQRFIEEHLEPTRDAWADTLGADFQICPVDSIYRSSQSRHFCHCQAILCQSDENFKRAEDLLHPNTHPPST